MKTWLSQIPEYKHECLGDVLTTRPLSKAVVCSSLGSITSPAMEMSSDLQNKAWITSCEMGFTKKVIDYLHNRNTAIAPVEHLAWEVIIVTRRMKNWVILFMIFPYSLHSSQVTSGTGKAGQYGRSSQLSSSMTSLCSVTKVYGCL